MRDVAQRLYEQLKQASPTTRLTILGATAVMFLLIGFSTYRASRPHYVLFSSGLDDARFAKVQNALAAEAVDFQFSQPPGPYSIYVDEGDMLKATNAVALSPALTPEARGILTASGMGDAFKDAKTRNAIFWKTQWQEMEKQLEALDFVRQAVVTTSIPSGSSLRRPQPATVSVTLDLEGALDFTRAQSETVATLVRFRFGVPAENVIVSDQSGRALFDGSRAMGDEGGDFFEQKLRWERENREQIMAMLAGMFGEGRAFINLHTEWNRDVSEKVTEKVDPDAKVVVQETRNKSKTPSGSVPAVGGAAGAVSNLAGLGTGTPSGGSGGEAATSEESTKTTVVSKEWGHVSSHSPVITRLSVALILDESVDGTLTPEKREQLDSAIKSAVGFSQERGDTYESFSTPFASIARDADGQPLAAEPEPVPEAPNPWLELLLERGVEIVAALAFVFLLLKTLKGAKAGRGAAQGDAAAGRAGGAEEGAALASEEIDPELLARAQIEELLQSDPERVGEILSRWAAEDTVSVKAG